MALWALFLHAKPEQPWSPYGLIDPGFHLFGDGKGGGKCGPGRVTVRARERDEGLFVFLHKKGRWEIGEGW